MIKKVMTREQKAKAVEIAISGGNPLDYIEECGSDRADRLWYTIKQDLKKHDPAKLAKIPKRLPQRGSKDLRKPEEKPPVLKVDGALEIRTKAPEKVTVQPDDGFRICGVRGQLGSWHFEGKVMDYSGINGDELYMPIEDWKLFLKELRKAAAMLGVELGE